jgi:hypothetical protein
MNCPEKEIAGFNKLIEVLFFALIALGISQMFGLVDFLDPLFKFLIPRGGTRMLGGGGRGVCLLTTEPSRAAFELLFIYITWVYIKVPSGARQVFLDIVLFLFFILVIRSAVGMVLFFMYLMLKYKLKLLLLTLSVVFLGFQFILRNIENMDSRSLKILYTIMVTLGPDQIFRYILNESGHRLISLLSSYKYAFAHPFGGGIGLWMYSSLDALNSVNIDSSEVGYFATRGYFSARPSSYMANIALDMGVVGIVSVLYMIKPVFALLRDYRRSVFPIVVCFLFAILFNSDTGNPIPWFCVALVCRYNRI